MKKSKRAISFILTFLSAITLCSCGKTEVSGMMENPADSVSAYETEKKDDNPLTPENEKSAANFDNAENQDLISGNLQPETGNLENVNINAQSVNGNAQDDTSDNIDLILSKMSTREKIAQMMIVALRSDSGNSKTATQITPEYAQIIEKYDFGGMIFFTGNINDKEQTVRLINDSQSLAINSKNGIPMFICVDQEGGIVNRVPFGCVMPGNMALAATGDTSLTKNAAFIIGSEITSLGFNVDFAPVSDVNNNPENPIIGVRSFSDDPAIVSSNVCAYMSGLNDAGCIAALKHFPGHGNVSEDSHTGLPSSALTLDELKKCELIPFKAGIDTGAEMIMTAHIEFPNIEQNTYISKKDGRKICLPATLSHTILTDLLRNEMGYKGLIITDALDMGAIADNFEKTDAAKLAINAGADILLCPVNIYKDGSKDTFGELESYISTLEKYVENGEISEERINESVKRILKLKSKKGILDHNNHPSYEERINNALTCVGSPEHRIREWEITLSSMTLLKNEGNVLPINGNGNAKTLILIPSEKRRSSVEYALKRLLALGNASASNTSVICYNGMSIYNKELQNALNASENVLILSQSTEKSSIIESIIKEVHQTEGKKAVLISLNLPYDAALYNADAVICAYNAYGNAYDFAGNGPFNLNVSVSICTAFGESTPKGILPVDIPVTVSQGRKTVYTDEILYHRGYGLINWGA